MHRRSVLALAALLLAAPFAAAQAPPTVSVTDATVSEGDAGTRTLAFAVTLSHAPAAPATVDAATVACGATEGVDYTGVSQRLFFVPGGPLTQTLQATVFGDTAVEATETFTLQLSAASGVSLAGDDRAEGVIDDDEERVQRAGARGDWDKDGHSDLLVWYDDRSGDAPGPVPNPSGRNIIWGLVGTRAGVLAVGPPVPAAGWAVAAFDDFDGDETPEIAWWHPDRGLAVAPLDSFEPFAPAGELGDPVSPTGARYLPVGSGQFDSPADGNADLLVWDTATGSLSVWFMDGPTVRATAPTDPPAPGLPFWQAQATGDFNGDGKADILWRHVASHRMVVWFMDGLTRTVGAYVQPDLTDPDQQLVAVGDFNADSSDDLAFQSAATGRLQLWFLDGLEKICGAHLAPWRLDLLEFGEWAVEGPR